MRLSITKDLVSLRAKAETQVDAMAEACRGKYITPGAGQAMVYARKEREAEMIQADPGIDPALVPHLALEANAAGVALLDLAVIVKAKASEWLYVSPPIEGTRLSTKSAIRQATSPVEIDALVAQAKSIFDQTV